MFNFFTFDKITGLKPKHDLNFIVKNSMNNSKIVKELEKIEFHNFYKFFESKKIKPKQEALLALNLNFFNEKFFQFDRNEAVFFEKLDYFQQEINDEFIIENITKKMFPNVFSEFTNFCCNKFSKRAVFSLNNYFKFEDINYLIYSLSPKPELNFLINFLLRKKKIKRIKNYYLPYDSQKMEKQNFLEINSSFSYLKRLKFKTEKKNLNFKFSKKLLENLKFKNNYILITFQKKISLKFDNIYFYLNLNKLKKKKYENIIFVFDNHQNYLKFNFYFHMIYENLSILQGIAYDLKQYFEFNFVKQIKVENCFIPINYENEVKNKKQKLN